MKIKLPFLDPVLKSADRILSAVLIRPATCRSADFKIVPITIGLEFCSWHPAVADAFKGVSKPLDGKASVLKLKKVLAEHHWFVVDRVLRVRSSI